MLHYIWDWDQKPFRNPSVFLCCSWYPLLVHNWKCFFSGWQEWESCCILLWHICSYSGSLHSSSAHGKETTAKWGLEVIFGCCLSQTPAQSRIRYSRTLLSQIFKLSRMELPQPFGSSIPVVLSLAMKDFLLKCLNSFPVLFFFAGFHAYGEWFCTGRLCRSLNKDLQS